MYYVDSNGVKIAVYETNCKQTDTVFLVHGWPLTHEMYEYQINLLTEKGYHVVAIDLRGFGASDMPSCGYGYDDFATDIYNVVCALGLKRFTLVGFSMGGAIVLRYMRLFRGFGVKQLILLAAAAPSWVQRPGFPYGLTREAVDQLICQARTDRPQLAYDFSHKQLFASCQTDAAKRWFEQIAMHATGFGTIQALISLRDETGFDDLKAVRVPTTILHGEKDIVVDNDLAIAQHRGIANSELVQLAHSGHGIVYDELQRFNAQFLRAIESC